MSQNRILIISDAWEPQVNGVVRTYQYLKQALEHKGHIVQVIGPHEFNFTVPMPGYAEIRLAIGARKKLYEKMVEFSPNVLHVATEGPLGWGARDFARAKEISFTTAYHTDFPGYIAARLTRLSKGAAHAGARVTERYLRRFHAPASGIFVSTPTLARQLSDLKFTSPTYAMTRGVDETIFTPEGPRADLGLRAPIALYVGRVAREKNLEAFLTMPWPGSKVVVGDGPLRAAYMRDYPKVYFAGLRQGHDLAAMYRAADVFVFPSRTDTFGMVLIEALACGVPIAAYPVPGPVDIVDQPYLGVLDDDLARAAHLALSCGSAADRVRHVRDHYTWQKAADQFIESCHPFTKKAL